MIREYKTIEEISGPLMIVRMVENVTYDEQVEIELSDGTVRRGKVRRAKLYYLRNLTGKKARIAEKRTNA